MSGTGGDRPLELLRETATRSPHAVLFAEEAGNSTARDVAELAASRLEAYRQAGIGPGCRVGVLRRRRDPVTADATLVSRTRRVMK